MVLENDCHKYHEEKEFNLWIYFVEYFGADFLEYLLYGIQESNGFNI